MPKQSILPGVYCGYPSEVGQQKGESRAESRPSAFRRHEVSSLRRVASIARNNLKIIVLFHILLKNGKVWLQQNNTEDLIGDDLIAQGIPKSDIVLGFQPEEIRPATGFAVS